MAVRLYDGVWLRVEGEAAPLKAQRNPKNSAQFFVGNHTYDIDGSPVNRTLPAPRIESLLSLSDVREAGLDLVTAPPVNLPY